MSHVSQVAAGSLERICLEESWHMLVPVIIKRPPISYLEWNRVRTTLGRGGSASFVSISSAIMFAIRSTRSSIAHSSYFAGSILTAAGADLVRLGANSSFLVAADWSVSKDFLFMLGDSGFKIGLVGEGGMLVGATTAGLGGSARGGN